MNRSRKIFFFFTLIAALNVLHAQDNTNAVQQVDLPRFYLDALSFASDSAGQKNLSRLDIYIELPYEMLSFTKNGDMFSASYEITVDIFNTANALLNEQIWTEKVETKNFEESISKHVGKISMESFPLEPGVYSVAVQVRDNETKKISKRKKEVRVKDYSSPTMSISDILLVSRLNKESEKMVIVPNVSGNVGNTHDGFYVFFDAYQRDADDSGKILLTVRTASGEIVLRDSMMKKLTSHKTSCIMKANCGDISAGDYTLEIRLLPAIMKQTSDTSTVISTRTFSVRLRGLPMAVKNLDTAIEELKYIADDDKIDSMKESAPAEKKRLFSEFWKKRDPSPKTEYNELMEEYYTRVEYSNKNFSHYMEGWKTDRGMVYIIFGLPNNIERHPFDMDAKPYEVWTYYEINREFTFVDASGFGDYRLMNPIWDAWRTRYR